MKTAAVIAECNPMHQGHARLLTEIRKKGFDTIVVILGSNFAQRGDVTLFDKWTRTSALLSCGADLVVELPVISTLTSAENFAKNGVYLANALGGIDTLFFGSECGDLSLLQKACALTDSTEGQEAIAAEMAKGKAYPRAVSEAITPLLSPENADLFSANNILGMEYLRSGKRLGVDFDFATLPRFAYGEGECGASDIRRTFLAGKPAILQSACPKKAAAIFQKAPCFQKELGSQAVFARLRLLSEKDWQAIDGVRDGLENTLMREVVRKDNLESLYLAIKSKRYSHARIRRIVFLAFLGIEKDLTHTLPPYLRILGMNDKGRAFLGRCNPTLPLSVSLKKLSKSGEAAKIFAQKEADATEAARFFTTTPLPFGREFTTPFCSFLEKEGEDCYKL